MQTNFKPLYPVLSLLLASTAVAETPSLGAIQVTATRQPTRVSETLSDVTVIEREQLERAAQTGLAEFLATQPGVNIATRGGEGSTSDVMLRGARGDHTILLIDGIRVGSATNGNVPWSRIPLNQIERIEILRGPASSLYGADAIGGVIQIFTRQGDQPLSHYVEAGRGSRGTENMQAGLSGKQEGWRYALNVSRFHTRGINSRPWGAYNRDRDGFTNETVSGQLAYQFQPGQEAGLQFWHAEGENLYDGGTSNTTRMYDWRLQSRQTSGQIYTRNKITDDWHSTLRLGESVDKSEDLSQGNLSSLFQTNQRQYVWQHDVQSSFGKWLLAAERTEQNIDTTSAYPIKDRHNDSFLLGWRQGFGSNALQVNLRQDDNSQFGDKTTGGLAYGYRFSPNWRTNLSYGTAFKAPTFNDLYYPLRSGLAGNPNLKPEESRQREASLHYEQGDTLVSATWYLNQVENLIVWPSVGTPSNVGAARLEGLTLSYQTKLATFDLTSSYDYLEAKDQATHLRLTQRAAHQGKVSLGQSLGAWQWQTEILAVSHRYGDSNNTQRLAGYTLTNLYATYQLDAAWSVFGRVNNVFDRNYVLVTSYDTPGTSVFLGVRYQNR